MINAVWFGAIVTLFAKLTLIVGGGSFQRGLKGITRVDFGWFWGANGATVPAFWTKKDAPGRARHLSGGSLADLTEKDQVPAAGNALPVNGHAVFSLVLAVSCAVSRTHDGRRLPRS